MNNQNNNKSKFFPWGKSGLQRCAGWTAFGSALVSGGVALAVCESSVALAALSLLYCFVWV